MKKLLLQMNFWLKKEPISITLITKNYLFGSIKETNENQEEKIKKFLKASEIQKTNKSSSSVENNFE